MAAQNRVRRFDISHAALITLAHMRVAIAQLGASFAGGLAGLANERAESMLRIAARSARSCALQVSLARNARVRAKSTPIRLLLKITRRPRIPAAT